MNIDRDLDQFCERTRSQAVTLLERGADPMAIIGLFATGAAATVDHFVKSADDDAACDLATAAVMLTLAVEKKLGTSIDQVLGTGPEANADRQAVTRQ